MFGRYDKLESEMQKLGWKNVEADRNFHIETNKLIKMINNLERENENLQKQIKGMSHAAKEDYQKLEWSIKNLPIFNAGDKSKKYGLCVGSDIRVDKAWASVGSSVGSSYSVDMCYIFDREYTFKKGEQSITVLHSELKKKVNG